MKGKEPRNRQLVVNLEDSFYSQFMDLASKNKVSGSTLARRLIIRHLMDLKVLPEQAVLDTLL